MELFQKLFDFLEKMRYEKRKQLGKDIIMKYKLIAGILLFCSLTPVPVRAVSIDSLEEKMEINLDRIERKQEEKESLVRQKTDLNKEIEDVTVEILELSRSVDVLKASISKKNTEIENKESDIEEKVVEIRQLEADISKKETEIELKEDEIEEQEKLLSKRVRAFYMNNPYQGILITLLESKSIIDFLDRIYLVRKMTDADNEAIDTMNRLLSEISIEKEMFQEMKVEQESQKNSLEKERDELREKKNELLKEKNHLDNSMISMKELESKKKAAYNSMTAAEQHLAQEIGDMMQENEQLEAEIQELIREAQRKAEEERKRKEEEARRKAEEEAARNNRPVPETSPVIPSSSGYLRPVPGRITSPFGYRIHPIWGYKKFHYGIDFAGATGSTIKATRSGIVISAQYFAGYGNTVIIDHGDGMSSLYAHMNSFDVSYGQTVSQGQRIGGVGSTGDSTGPHLHFEIRKNGVRMNPADYVN